MLILALKLTLCLVFISATTVPTCVQCAGNCYFDTCGAPNCLPDSSCTTKCNPVITTTNICPYGCVKNNVTNVCQAVTKTPTYIHTLQQAQTYCSSTYYGYADTSTASNGNSNQWDSTTSFLCPYGCAVSDPSQTNYQKNNLCNVGAYYSNCLQYSYTPICRRNSLFPELGSCAAIQCTSFSSALQNLLSCDNVMLVCPIGYIFEKTFPQCGSNITDTCNYNNGIIFSKIECLNKINGIKCKYYRDLDCSRRTIVQSCPSSCGCTLDPLRSRCKSSDSSKICGAVGVKCPLNFTVSVEGGCYGDCLTPTCDCDYTLKYVDNGKSGYPLCFPNWYYD